MKKILVPTDFSPTAENALTYAAHLGKTLEAKIHLLHSYELMRKTGMILSIERHIVGEAQKDIAEESARATVLSGINTTTNVRKGYNDEVIASEAKKMSSDLVIMGTKGASGMKEVFLGSNTVRAIKYTEAPILVVPDEADYQPIKKVLLAADSNFFSDAKAIEPLKYLLEKTGAQLIVLHVDDGNKEPSPTPFKLLLAEHFGEGNYEFHEIHKPDIGRAIMEFSYKINADVLCMIHHYRNFLDRLFTSSTTFKTAFHTDMPLLVLKD